MVGLRKARRDFTIVFSRAEKFTYGSQDLQDLPAFEPFKGRPPPYLPPPGSSPTSVLGVQAGTDEA